MSKANKVVVKLLCILLPVLLLISFLSAGKFLVIYDEPKKVDVIVVLSGEAGRLEQGLKLYELGYAENIILSNSSAFNISKNLLLNIPKNHLFLEDKAMSTYDNAVFTKEIMDRQLFDTAIVVSTDYHMRRVKWNFERVFKKYDHKLIYIGSQTGYKPTIWWSQSHSVKMTIAEYIKMFGNVFGIHGSEAKRKMYNFKEWFQYKFSN